jgi:hypothetical protein
VQQVQPAFPQGGVRGVAAGRLSGEPQLGAQAGQPVMLVTLGKAVDDPGGQGDRMALVGVDQGQQGLGQAGQVPAGDARLLGVGVASPSRRWS